MAGKKGKSGRIPKKTAEKKYVEMKPKPEPEVKEKPYPTLGQAAIDFEKKLDEQLGIDSLPKEKSQAELPPEIDIEFVTEACKWPFDIWAGSQKLSTLKLSDKEAKSLAEPLTRIVNRRKWLIDKLKPDYLDLGLLVVRGSAILRERFKVVTTERIHRQGQESRQAGATGKGRPVAPVIEQGVPI